MSYYSLLKDLSSLSHSMNNIRTAFFFSIAFTINLPPNLAPTALITNNASRAPKSTTCQNTAYMYTINFANQMDFLFDNSSNKTNIIAAYPNIKNLRYHIC